MTEESYNDDEVYALHIAGDCPYDCPFCFDDDEEIERDPWQDSDGYGYEETNVYYPEEEPSEG